MKWILPLIAALLLIGALFVFQSKEPPAVKRQPRSPIPAVAPTAPAPVVPPSSPPPGVSSVPPPQEQSQEPSPAPQPQPPPSWKRTAFDPKGLAEASYNHWKEYYDQENRDRIETLQNRLQLDPRQLEVVRFSFTREREDFDALWRFMMEAHPADAADWMQTPDYASRIDGITGPTDLAVLPVLDTAQRNLYAAWRAGYNRERYWYSLSTK